MNFHNSLKLRTAKFVALPLILLLTLIAMPDLATAQTGTVNIGEEVKIAPGETGIVEISVNGLPSPGVAAIQVGPKGKLTYGPKILQLKNIAGLQGFSINSKTVDNDKGEATFVATAPGGAVKTGNIIELTFKVPGRPQLVIMNMANKTIPDSNFFISPSNLKSR